MPSTIKPAFLAVLLLWVWSTWLLHKNFNECGVFGPGSLMDDVPIDKSQIQRRQSDSLTKSAEVEVSACMIIMDGNHFLIEWLAYHYHSANLRHLIIHSDKNSATSPSEVLDRWRDRITIQEWNETDFLDSTKYKDLGSYQMHKQRQQIFYQECLKDLQRQGRDWGLLIDPDEYLTIEEPNNESTKPTPTVSKILQSFQSFQIPFGLDITYNPCIAIRRRQFTMDESTDEIVQSVAPPGFDGRSFQTLRWRKIYYKGKRYTTKSGESCLVTKRFNQIPNKVIIDLHRLDPKVLSSLYEDGTVHRPLEICPSPFFEKTAFVLNHYSGTKEQWLSRSNDGRGSAVRTAKYEFLHSLKGQVEDDSIRPWLKDFVADVGTNEALRLLKGVGKAPPLPEESNNNIANNKYSVGDLVEVEYILEPGNWYEAEVFDSYPNDHYSIVFVDDCGVEHTSLDIMRPLKNGTDTKVEKQEK